MDSKLIGKYLIIIAITIAFYCAPEANALVSHQVSSVAVAGYPIKIYWITGEITSTDVNQVKTIVQNITADTDLYFKLDSSGGDIYVAMEIGKLMRKARATIIILEGSKCHSSCVFVLAGGVERMVGGEVGIHRPYSTYVGKRDYESTQNEYRKMETTARAYLLEMNLPSQLFDAMVRVPPEEIRILSYAETKSFGLAEDDPVEQETEDSKEAYEYGISKAEYFQRKASVDKICPIPPPSASFQKIVAWDECKEAVMYGLQLQIYKTRRARVKDVCSAYKGNAEKLQSCIRKVLQVDR